MSVSALYHQGRAAPRSCSAIDGSARAHPDDSVVACRRNDRDKTAGWTRHPEIVIDPARSGLAESAWWAIGW
jgi:hypothetical protein